MNNASNNNIFNMFGTPERIVIDGTVATHPVLIASYIKVMREKHDQIKAFTISRIGGVVKVYVATKPAKQKAKSRWFDKYIGCAFYIGNDTVAGASGEYVFCGVCEHSDHDNRRDPLQYEFYAEGKPQILLSYKEARKIMGAMIDANTYGRRV